MDQTLTSSDRVSEAESSRQAFLAGFGWMLLARTIDEKFASLYRAGKIHGGVYIGKGQEALSAAIGMALREGDVFAPLIRDGAGRLAFGESILDAARTYMGSSLGPMRGRDGSVHRGRPREGLLPMLSHLGAMIPVVNGALMAKRFKGQSGFVGAACIGDGATSTGAFHEGLNQAAVENLPLVLVVADNQFAYSTPTTSQFACASLVDKAKGYGVRGHTADGVDLGDCLRVLSRAADLARGGDGPQLVIGNLLRLCGHGEHDDAHYISPELKASPLGQDCIELAEQRILDESWAAASDIAEWKATRIKSVEETVAQVQREPSPDPYKESWYALASKHLSETYENF
ncbi:MAG: TPP-dependent pyruvate/acetoin dehydrogenase alpha subunit [Limisphaerales bacterium]|jgi:TPP-dependent pyruvate/acetoin dehydrogenase alpha subunit